jgi:hypothetical protein
MIAEDRKMKDKYGISYSSQFVITRWTGRLRPALLLGVVTRCGAATTL